MKRVNVLPNVITAFGLACGLFVIFRVGMATTPTYEFLYHMTLILLLAGLADLLDGAVARAIKAESEFGLVFDSLADAISFGVAPSILFLKFLSLPGGGPLAFFALAGAMIYTVCGVLRLVRFNIRAAQIKDKDDDAKKTFIGLPIPAAAACAISPNIFVHSPLFQEWVVLGQTTEAILLPAIMIVVGYLMISKIRFPSLKSIHLRIPSFNLVFVSTLLACFVLYGLLYYLPALLLVTAWGYVIGSLSLALIRMISAKNQTIVK